MGSGYGLEKGWVLDPTLPATEQLHGSCHGGSEGVKRMQAAAQNEKAIWKPKLKPGSLYSSLQTFER